VYTLDLSVYVCCECVYDIVPSCLPAVVTFYIHMYSHDLFLRPAIYLTVSHNICDPKLVIAFRDNSDCYHSSVCFVVIVILHIIKTYKHRQYCRTEVQ
jgi:hypothetical protein